MDRELLLKVQPQLLDIVLEIRRVCQENDIRFFLACGTFLGAVRHQGFIPWDDDLDIGMLREDYEKFCRIAPEKLGENYCLQNWYTDPAYAHPFGKVRRKHTVYLEAKASRLQENGFYVDVFPFDYAPEDPGKQAAYGRKLMDLYRTKLMKCGAKPWMNGEKINWKKRIGYLLYQGKALFCSSEALSRKYDALATSIPRSNILCRQRGLARMNLFPADWCRNLSDYLFEGELLPGPANYDAFLTTQFGDYRTLPPEDQRENRHQIVKVVFDDESGSL